MLSQFQSIWHGHLSCIHVAKHRVELLHLDSAPYRAGPNTREFEKPETDKMLVENIIKPAQTEKAAPIVFVSRKEKILRFKILLNARR